MKQIETTSVVSFGPGAVMALSNEQAEPRLRVLKMIEPGVYEALAIVQMKKGERFGFDGEIPKTMRASVLVDGKPVETETPVVPKADAGPVKFVMPKARDIPAGRKK